MSITNPTQSSDASQPKLSSGDGAPGEVKKADVSPGKSLLPSDTRVGNGRQPETRQGRVITVGRETALYLSPAVKRLQSQGFRHLMAHRPADLPKLLTQVPARHEVAILVYNGPGCDTAIESLRALEDDYPEIPVIVVVNQGIFDEYYELMSSGAYDYFGVVEGMAVIASAVRWATRTDAIPARAAAPRPRPGQPKRGPQSGGRGGSSNPEHPRREAQSEPRA